MGNCSIRCCDCSCHPVQVMTPGWLEGALGKASTSALGAALIRFQAFIQATKLSNPLGLTLTHGTLLKAIAEVLAQVIPQCGDPLGAWIDPLRIFRSTIASVLSSSLTFYYWSRIVAGLGISAPGFVRAVL